MDILDLSDDTFLRLLMLLYNLCTIGIAKQIQKQFGAFVTELRRQ